MRGEGDKKTGYTERKEEKRQEIRGGRRETRNDRRKETKRHDMRGGGNETKRQEMG